MSATSTIRYIAKGTSLIRSISFRKKRMDNKANINALMKPTTKNGMLSVLKYSRFFTKDRKLAPAMIGTAMMNVKSEAVRWLIPSMTPPEIVAPEREKPGHKESTWTKPTASAFVYVI